MPSTLQIVAMPSTFDFALKVYEELCTFPEFYSKEYVIKKPIAVETKKFADGEIEIYIPQSIRGVHVFFFASSGRNRYNNSPAESKIEMYHTLDAIKRSRPSKIIIFEPYCSPARSDRTMGRNSVGFWIHYKTLMNLGVDTIITYQLHSEKSKTIIDPSLCDAEDIPVTPILMEYITSKYIKDIDYFKSEVSNSWVFCSVDSGSERFAHKFAKAFQTQLVIAFKQRNYSTLNSVKSIKLLTATSLENKQVWVVDDMIDTGNSISALLYELEKQKVGTVNIATVHPVFSPPALEKIATLYKKGLFDRLHVVDTIYDITEIAKQYPFIEIIPCAQLTAQVLLRVFEKKSLGPFFDDFNVMHHLKNLSYRTL